MFGLLAPLLSGLLNIGDKLVEDKDKKNEYAFKVLQMSQDLSLKLLETQTYPWIDGIVKLAYAMEQIIKGLFRPLGSLAALGYVLWCHAHGIPIPDWLQAGLTALFPGWMASRYQEKKRSGP